MYAIRSYYVVPSHLLDHQLFEFKTIDRHSGIIDGGDLAFDKPSLPPLPTLDIEATEQLDT